MVANAQATEDEKPSNPRVKLGGFVKMDLIHDFDPINDIFGFQTRDIVVAERPPHIPSSQTVFTARTSRAEFKLETDTRWGVFKTRLEGDFANQDNLFHLRHAYGFLGGLLAGQTWSTFVSEISGATGIRYHRTWSRRNPGNSLAGYRCPPALGKRTSPPATWWFTARDRL
jgi:hypothetical protein